MTRIYIADLNAYNAGNLRGDWIDLEDMQGRDDLQDAITAIAGSHDWAVHDYEDCPNMGEHPCLDELAAIIEVCHEQGWDADMLFAVEHCMSELCGGAGSLAQCFEDSFSGIWPDEESYACELVDSCYDLDRMLGMLAHYFDYDKFTRDLFMTDYFSLDLPSGNVAVFRNC